MNNQDNIIDMLLNLEIGEIKNKKCINKEFEKSINSCELYENLIKRDFKIDIFKDNKKVIYNKIDILKKISILKGLMLSLKTIQEYDIKYNDYEIDPNEE